MRDLLRADPKRMELQKELHDERKKELRLYQFSLDFKKLVGRSNAVLFAISEMYKIYK